MHFDASLIASARWWTTSHRQVRDKEEGLTHSGAVNGDIDLTLVIMRFQATDVDRLLAVLSRYVVLTRGHAGCRNVDLALSSIDPERVVVVQKWESPAAQRTHFDSDDMVEMARAATALLRSPPDIDLLDGVSAHDLR